MDKPSHGLSQVGKKNVISSHAMSFSIDFLIKHFSLPLPTHMKIDVDGIEFLILQGATNALSNLSKLIVECNTEKNGNFVKIKTFLEDNGMNLSKICEPETAHTPNIVNVIFVRKKE